MCGRFTLRANAKKLHDDFPMFQLPDGVPRFNIAPTQDVLAVRQQEGAPPKGAWLRWGLIPSWAKDKKMGASLINARADSVASKPSFRTAGPTQGSRILGKMLPREWEPNYRGHVHGKLRVSILRDRATGWQAPGYSTAAEGQRDRKTRC
jgi:hypothetical protein